MGLTAAEEATMVRYRIEEHRSMVSIAVSEVGGQQDRLLEAFSECRNGHCACPTAEYDKLASIVVRHTGDAIQIRLEAKPGARIDTSQIAACLDYTTAKVSGISPEQNAGEQSTSKPTRI